MPIIQSAKKKMRRDAKREIANNKVRNQIQDLLKKARKQPSAKTISAAASVLDKAVKVNLMHLNKASRLKSRLSKGLPQVKVKAKVSATK